MKSSLWQNTKRKWDSFDYFVELSIQNWHFKAQLSAYIIAHTMSQP
jgi:hypothetical protein